MAYNFYIFFTPLHNCARSSVKIEKYLYTNNTTKDKKMEELYTVTFWYSQASEPEIRPMHIYNGDYKYDSDHIEEEYEQQYRDIKTLYISNLEPTIQEEQLRATFKYFGIIETIEINTSVHEIDPFTPLNIYNGTPSGRLNRDLRATLPINELKGNPLSEGSPILNLHRCKTAIIHYKQLYYNSFIGYLRKAIGYEKQFDKLQTTFCLAYAKWQPMVYEFNKASTKSQEQEPTPFEQHYIDNHKTIQELHIYNVSHVNANPNYNIYYDRFYQALVNAKPALDKRLTDIVNLPPVDEYYTDKYYNMRRIPIQYDATEFDKWTEYDPDFVSLY